MRTAWGVAFYVPIEQAGGLTPIHHWYDATTDAHRYEAQSPGPSYEDRGTVFHAAQMGGPGPRCSVSMGGRRTALWRSIRRSTSRSTYRRGSARLRRAATLDAQQFYDEDSGYVYWCISGQAGLQLLLRPAEPNAADRR